MSAKTKRTPTNRPQRRLIVMAGVCGALSASTAPLARAETTRELMALPPAASDKAAKHDLLSILKPVSKINPSGRSVLRGISMSTAPFGVGLTGLCEMDELFLRYAPTGSRLSGKDQPIRAVGFDATHYFHAVREPIKIPEQGENGSEGCEKLTGKQTVHWFSAKDVFDAARAINILLASVDAIKLRSVKFDACGLDGGGENCTLTVAEQAKINNLSEVENCDTFADHACFIFYLHGDSGVIKLTIEAAIDDNTLTPSKITSISAERVIVVT